MEWRGRGGRRKGGEERRDEGKKEERNGGKRGRGNRLTREMESRRFQGSSGQEATESQVFRGICMMYVCMYVYM